MRWSTPRADAASDLASLAADAANQPVPSIETLQLKDPKDFRYLGKGAVSIVDLHDITTGKAQYGADVRLPGMKYAVIARPPVTGGKLVSFDGADATESFRRREGDGGQGMAVALEIPAARRRRGDRAQYRCGDQGTRRAEDRLGRRSQRQVRLGRLPRPTRGSRAQAGPVVRKEGDVDAALKGADKVIVGEYYLPHLAHVSMEPPVAVADVKGDKAEIWAPVQSPGGTREDVAKTLGIPDGECDRQRHAARRRLRTQVEMRFRARSGAALEGARRAGEGAMDA